MSKQKVITFRPDINDLLIIEEIKDFYKRKYGIDVKYTTYDVIHNALNSYINEIKLRDW